MQYRQKRAGRYGGGLATRKPTGKPGLCSERSLNSACSPSCAACPSVATHGGGDLQGLARLQRRTPPDTTRRLPIQTATWVQLTFLRRRRAARPTPAKPISNILHVEGSGTADTCSAIDTLSIIGPKKVGVEVLVDVIVRGAVKPCNAVNEKDCGVNDELGATVKLWEKPPKVTENVYWAEGLSRGGLPPASRLIVY